MQSQSLAGNEVDSKRPRESAVTSSGDHTTRDPSTWGGSMDLTRRQWILSAAAGTSFLQAGCGGRPKADVPAVGGDTLARFPGKAPMRIINDRPPCLETPWRYFRLRPHAERGILRALAPAIDPHGNRPQVVAAPHRRCRGPSAGVIHGRPPADGRRRGGGREPVLGQLERLLRPERRRRTVGKWGDGQRPLGGGRARQIA